MSEQQGKSMISLLWLSAVVLIADLVTKHYASTLLEYLRPIAVMPCFNFTLVHNYGAAFSFLADQAGWQRWFFAILAGVVSIALVRWLATLRDDPLLGVAIALILGGALGNLYDRITLGYVVDFLDFYWNNSHFPAFNIADAGISIGAGLMIIDVFKSKKDER